jgi:hypothetical protein
MTIVIGTVNMGIASGATLMAFSNHIIGNALSYPLIKNKIFTYKFRR